MRTILCHLRRPLVSARSTHPGLLVSFIGRGVPGLHLVDWGIKGGRVRSFLRDAISSFGLSSSLFSHKQFHPEPPRFPRLVLKGFTCCRHQHLHQTHLENSRDNCQDKTQVVELISSTAASIELVRPRQGGEIKIACCQI